jgi:hypothetical protein
MNTNYIVYQAYGSIDILNEALYSMLSFYSVHGLDQKGIKLIVYTDTPEHFESILGKEKIDCRQIDSKRIQEWRGAIDFVHRVKIETLIHFSADIVDANILYLDSDISFMHPVNEIFQGISAGHLFMHDEEGALNSSKFPMILKMGKFIKSHKTQLSNVGITIAEDTRTWNAGVLGFNSSQKHLLKKVLCFTDQFYKLYPKHIAEQFGFSLYFGREGNVKTASKELFHYWSFKEFRIVLKDFFAYHENSDLQKLLEEIDLISPMVIGQPKAEYDKLHWFPKAFRKMRKERWIMPDYKYWKKNA